MKSLAVSIRPWIYACAFMLAAATQADAMCRGKPQVKLSDGSVACVLKKETTQFRNTQYIVGAGPSAARKSEHMGAAVVVKFGNEKDASSLSRKILAARAKELCKRYRSGFLVEISKPANPFMVVVMTWGDKPSRAIDSRKRTAMKVNTRWDAYFQKNCWIRTLR